MIIVSIYDKISEEFGPLGVVANTAVASRNFKSSMIKLVENPLIRADYELYCLGEFNLAQGIVKVTKDLIDEGSNYLPKAVG